MYDPTELTPSVIEAGADAIRGYLLPGDCWAEHMVEEAFLAMLNRRDEDAARQLCASTNPEPPARYFELPVVKLGAALSA